MSTHTPGPWAVAQRSVGKRQTTIVLDADRNEVCEAYDSAALIAAAPEMLRALQRLTHPAADDDDLAYAQSIIKKALDKA